MFGDFGAVIRLETHEHTRLPGDGGRKESLVLFEVELAVGLQVRRLGCLGRRGESCRFEDFFVCNCDASTLELLLEQHLIDELVVRPVFQRAALVKRDAPTKALLLLLLQIGHGVLPGCQQDFFAVDGRHRGGGRDGRSARQAGGLVQQEAADKRQNEKPPDVFRDAPHRLQYHGAGLLVSEERGKTR